MWTWVKYSAHRFPGWRQGSGRASPRSYFNISMHVMCSTLFTGADASLASRCIGIPTCRICLYSAEELLPWSEHRPLCNSGVSGGVFLGGFSEVSVTRASSSQTSSHALMRELDRRSLTLDLACGRAQPPYLSRTLRTITPVLDSQPPPRSETRSRS